MSKFEKDVESIMALFHDVSKNRWSGKTVDGLVWVAGYMPSKKELVVILEDREDSHKNTRIVIKEGERDKLFKTFKDLYGDEKISNEEEMTSELNEEASCGATCAACVATIAKPIGKTIKRRKHKKSKVSEAIDSVLFKESILNDMPCETKIGENTFKYFFNEGKWYMGVNNSLVKTFDKDVMMETFDQIVDGETVTTELLEDFSCYEMNILMEDGDQINKEDDASKGIIKPQTTTSATTNNSTNNSNTNLNITNNTESNETENKIIPRNKREDGEKEMKMDSTFASDDKIHQEAHKNMVQDAYQNNKKVTVTDFFNKNNTENTIDGTIEKIDGDTVTINFDDDRHTTQTFDISEVMVNDF